MLLLAWPVLCEQVLGFLVGLYDTWLSGHIDGISEVATGAVGLAAYVGWLASMLFALVATGTTALVARHRGAGETAAANRIMNRSLALAAVAGARAVSGRARVPVVTRRRRSLWPWPMAAPAGPSPAH